MLARRSQVARLVRKQMSAKIRLEMHSLLKHPPYNNISCASPLTFTAVGFPLLYGFPVVGCNGGEVAAVTSAGDSVICVDPPYFQIRVRFG